LILLLFRCRSIELQKPRRAERLYSSLFFVPASNLARFDRFRSNYVVFISTSGDVMFLSLLQSVCKPAKILRLRKVEFLKFNYITNVLLSEFVKCEKSTGFLP